MNPGRKFKLYSIKNEDKDDIFVSDKTNRYCDDNFFTLITGVNGCGKSSLLSKAVNSFIFHGRKDDVLVDNNSIDTPSRVIAICNSRYNRFPLRETFLRKGSQKNSDYYIQVNHNQEIGASVLSIVSQCLRELIKKPLNNQVVRLDDVRSAYKMIGINPFLLINLKFNDEAKKAYETLLDIQRSKKGTRISSELNDYYKKFLSDNENLILKPDVINIFQEYENIVRLPQLYLDIEKRKISFDGATRENEYNITQALLLGLIVPSEIQVQRTKESRWVSNHHLSSGQQTLLTTALLLDIFTINNSLICIDEPENSLHPAWQLDFMKFVDQLCKWNKGCHFLIATHSPQIISGLKSENGCIVTLKNNDHRISIKNKFDSVKRLENSFSNKSQSFHNVKNYRGQSADRQLAEIFETPGFRNDYVIHRLLMILSRLVKGTGLNRNDEPFIEMVKKFVKFNDIDESDPVNIIYNQIKGVVIANKKDSKK